MEKSNIAKLECLLATDLKFLGRFLVDPAVAVAEAKIDLNVQEMRRAEAFAKTAQEQVRLAGRLSGFQTSAKADWGIGMGCCNSKALVTLENRDTEAI
ncbi:MAG: hypothetical protein JWO09_1968 [Bacteroidetes bacterium]|nr:hypothetical protein [Bacteroidota bacterium]